MSSLHWLQEELAKPEVTDLCINGALSAFIDRGNGMEPFTPTPLPSETELRSWVIDQLSATGKTWDAKYPFVDGTLPTGHRLHVAFPPLAKPGPLISLRRLAVIPSDLTQARAESSRRWSSSPHYPRLCELVARGESLILSGSTGSGKTTLASDLLSYVPASERIVALEDTQELAPCHPHFLNLVSRPANADGFGEVGLRALLRQSLRMRPDRIVLGECRGAEVLDLLQTLNTGHRGAIATLHANSPRDALRRIELLCLLASGSIPFPAIRELLSFGIQWIAQVRREGAKRMISELWRIEGREGDTILMRPVL